MAGGRGGGSGADACCSGDNDHRDSAAAHLSARASALEAELAAADPTLQDCCRRDLEQEAKAARQQAALSRVDRASKAELARKLGGAVVPPPLPRKKAESDDGESDFDFDSEGDEDASLARLRELRLSQLKQRAAAEVEEEKRKKKEEKRGDDRELGAGRLSEVKVSKVFSLAASLSGPRRRELPFSVHLADAGSAAGAALDELLETLAGDFRGSRFARASPGAGSAAARASVLGAASLPAAVAAREGAGGVLAVFRGGSLVAAVPVSAFCSSEGGQELIEESVVSWLRKCRALARSKDEGKAESKKRGNDGEASPSSSENDSDAEEEEDGDADPCEVCGRTYFHTHVRPVRSGGVGGGNGGGRAGSDRDDDESGSD